MFKNLKLWVVIGALSLSVSSYASPEGLKLMKGSDCFTCHRVAQKLVGPAYKDVADKYKDQRPAIVATLVKKVKLGGAGVWGKAAMTAHPQHTDDQITKMITWILDLANAKKSDGGDSGSKAKKSASGKKEYVPQSLTEIEKEAKANIATPGCQLMTARPALAAAPYNPFWPVYLLLVGLLAIFRSNRFK